MGIRVVINLVVCLLMAAIAGCSSQAIIPTPTRTVTEPSGQLQATITRVADSDYQSILSQWYLQRNNQPYWFGPKQNDDLRVLRHYLLDQMQLPTLPLSARTGANNPTQQQQEVLLSQQLLILLDSKSATQLPVDGLFQPPNSYFFPLLHYYHALSTAEPELSEFIITSLLLPGDNHSEVSILRRKLARSGDWQEQPQADINTSHYDDLLRQSVMHFQRRHGLKPDGVVGQRTRQFLNADKQQRLDTVSFSLQRIAKRRIDYRQPYLLVNIPAYSLRYVDGPQTLAMRTIVGKPSTPTPALDLLASHLVINPSWNVPASLALRDFVPKLIKNPGYLDDQQIELYQGYSSAAPRVDPNSIDWSSVRGKFPYRMVQLPGQHNSLGAVKFFTPNDHDVLVHSTNRPAKFQNNQRALSSGCIRVEQPLVLASKLLADNPDGNRLMQYHASGKTRWIPVTRQVPIHVVYWPAWVDDQGKPQFRKDIYRQMPRAPQPLFSLNR